MSAIASQITDILTVQHFAQAHIKENIKAPRHLSPVDSLHKGPVTQKNISIWLRHHVMILMAVPWYACCVIWFT